jgi:hypothetical protein
MRRAGIVIGIVGVLVGWFAHSFTAGGGGTAYTLYRNSLTGATLRIHIATFDASEAESYNMENCQQAEALFNGQPGVKAHFWCEKGSYRR